MRSVDWRGAARRAAVLCVRCAELSLRRRSACGAPSKVAPQHSGGARNALKLRVRVL